MKIVGRKITENLGFESPLLKFKIFCPFFLFIFKFFTQNWVSLILTIFWYLVLLFRNQIKHVENVCFYWYLICKTRYSKMVKNKDMQFWWRIWKWKEKKDKNFLTFQSGDSNPRFLVIFPPTIWIFMDVEGDKIKSRLGSKNFLTLTKAVNQQTWACGNLLVYERFNVTENTTIPEQLT